MGSWITLGATSANQNINKWPFDLAERALHSLSPKAVKICSSAYFKIIFHLNHRTITFNLHFEMLIKHRGYWHSSLLWHGVKAGLVFWLLNSVRNPCLLHENKIWNKSRFRVWSAFYDNKAETCKSLISYNFKSTPRYNHFNHPGDDFKTSYGLPSDPRKYCIVVNYVVFEANKIKFKPIISILRRHLLDSPKSISLEQIFRICRFALVYQLLRFYSF